MSEIENNLLVNLHKLAKRQDENFHTEALVHLLRHLVQYDRASAVKILKKITGETLDLERISIITQAVTTKGHRPDIEISTQNHLIYIEVKVKSGLGKDQLDRYRKALDESNFNNTNLILLTKNPLLLDEDEEKADLNIRWYQIAEWLEDELEDDIVEKGSSRYLIKQFLDFLKERGMTLEQVSAEFTSEEFKQGINSLQNLMDMLNKSLRLADNTLSIKLDADLEWVGYYFKIDSDWYWVGISYDVPNVLQFGTEAEITEDDLKKLDLGYISPEDDNMWMYDLNLEELSFFELPKAKQLEHLENFINKSLGAVKRLYTT